ncbi:hypothetical protein [Nocardioides plantarum]|uniref:Lipoprotein n=1 Tax=Nocardioides plantarum TaxID=29299 RepID=A0ABV5K5Z3_9ACTN|nr:hypothetical protein [Nocardioides plantarum]
MTATVRAPRPRGLTLALAALVLLLVVVGLVRLVGDDEPAGRAREAAPAGEPGSAGSPPSTSATSEPSAEPSAGPTSSGATQEPEVPRTHAADGHVFGKGRVLVAYYGTGSTGSLGVLGEDGPEAMHRRLQKAARPFRALGTVQLVYELIVTVADRSPGPDGTYSHDIPRAVVEEYVEAARRHHALLVLDIQPGRARFLDVVKRWEWALREPHVGLALDPEWRMAPGEVPGSVIGSTSAAEVNAVSRWLSDLTRRQDLPEKVFVLHQFRAAMIRSVSRVVARPGLAMVQHVDGFGTPREKLATYRAVARPRAFTMGFKLFYDEDQPLMSARDVAKIRPKVRFVTFQ